ncbi:MAG: NAD(+)/NADH kinase [Oscillospiraceae bacterium]
MSIGIIVNPASGKDIRRLVSHATVIDNNEKLSIVKRAVLGAFAMGTRDFLIMPDTCLIGQLVLETLEEHGQSRVNARLLDMVVTSSAQDTVRAAQLMEDAGAGCVLVLGGDGTSRAAAKALHNTPLLPVSTGTNNVYPTLVEGTIAGMCASIVEQVGRVERCCTKDKRIEIWMDGEMRDIALVDAVISRHSYAGARAIWNMDEIIGVLAIRAHPQNIGFSAIVGCARSVLPQDDFGYYVELSSQGTSILAPIAPGIVERLSIQEPQRFELGEALRYTAPHDCMIALDGEREVHLARGKTAELRITRNGPWHVDTCKTMEYAQAAGLLAESKKA